MESITTTLPEWLIRDLEALQESQGTWSALVTGRHGAVVGLAETVHKGPPAEARQPKRGY